METTEKLGFESLCVHAGIGEYEYGPVVPPLFQTSTFRFRSAEHGARLFAGEEKGYIYTRMLNPTVEAMENAVAALEGGHKALGCGSGMAAVHTALAALLKSGDHVICSKAVYGPTSTLLRTIMADYGVASSFVDTADIKAVEKAFLPETKAVYVETPGNPTLSITDLKKTAGLCREKKAVLVVDNTFMSPALQQPLALGADVVIHSLTKFLNGHADVIGGIIVVRDEERYLRFRKVLNQLGGVIDPFNSFLVHRGIKTLSLRMARHCESALKVAQFLEAHQKVKSVRFPGLPSHPQHELSKRQHRGPGGMIAFELKDGMEAGRKMMNAVKLCQLAVSLGGVESLIQHPASMTHASMGPSARLEAGITDGLV
ncbi:MAG: aminotransferase class I/II-fold pyridoxal phosphate-dependent enzyme, partial [bacterium]